MAQEVERRIRDPHLRQIFLRFATYNGSSPYRTPATFNIIPYVEAKFGAWYVRGGLTRIAEKLAELAEKLGVKFRYSTTAAAWYGDHAVAEDGTRCRASYLICNADVLGAMTGFLSPRCKGSVREKILQPALSSSGFILFLGVRGRDARLAQHNIFFSNDYPREFGQIHNQKISPTEPTIYISISARSDSDHAPPDHDNYFVMVNVPARSAPWSEEEIQAYQDLILRRLDVFGFHLPERIVSEWAFTPTDFATRDLAFQGSLYGWASHSVRTSLFRPPLRAPGKRNVFFVGGTTHPGGGIPLVLLSGKMVADSVERDIAS